MKSPLSQKMKQSSPFPLLFKSGTYSVLLPGNEDGISLQSGSVVQEEVTEVGLTATDDYLEGENALQWL